MIKQSPPWRLRCHSLPRSRPLPQPIALLHAQRRFHAPTDSGPYGTRQHRGHNHRNTTHRQSHYRRSSTSTSHISEKKHQPRGRLTMQAPPQPRWPRRRSRPPQKCDALAPASTFRTIVTVAIATLIDTCNGPGACAPPVLTLFSAFYRNTRPATSPTFAGLPETMWL